MLFFIFSAFSSSSGCISPFASAWFSSLFGSTVCAFFLFLASNAISFLSFPFTFNIKWYILNFLFTSGIICVEITFPSCSSTFNTSKFLLLKFSKISIYFSFICWYDLSILIVIVKPKLIFLFEYPSNCLTWFSKFPQFLFSPIASCLYVWFSFWYM